MNTLPTHNSVMGRQHGRRVLQAIHDRLIPMSSERDSRYTGRFTKGIAANSARSDAGSIPVLSTKSFPIGSRLTGIDSRALSVRLQEGCSRDSNRLHEESRRGTAGPESAYEIAG
jgi:hypothetical protein